MSQSIIRRSFLFPEGRSLQLPEELVAFIRQKVTETVLGKRMYTYYVHQK